MSGLIDSLSRTWRETAKTFKLLARNKMGMFGFLMTLTIVFLAFFGPIIWPPEASANVEDINAGISEKHWLGADFQGQDNLRKIVSGGKEILIVAFLTGVLATLFGVVIGSFSAFVGGNVDSFLMELVNIWLTIPRLPLLAVIATVIRLGDPVTFSLLMATLDWASLSRQVRSQVLSLKKRDYIEAATMLGLGTRNIIFSELMPNMMSFITISMIGIMVHAIYMQTSLVFLGIVPYSGANWGVMIVAAMRRGVLYNPQAMWSILAPMGAIVLFQLALISFARSLDEVFNPRLRTTV